MTPPARSRSPVMMVNILTARQAACQSESGFENRLAREDGRVAQLLLDPQELVVFRHAVAARSRSGLDLSRIRRHRQVRDRRVLGLAGTVRDHRAITRALGH